MNEISKNNLYNEVGCHHCWWLITTLDDLEKVEECYICKRNKDELLELREKYRKSLRSSD